MDNAPELEPLGFVQDRITILRAAHTTLKDFGLDFDVADLLDVAGWLAGDTLPVVSPDTPPVMDDGDETEDESEETGA